MEQFKLKKKLFYSTIKRGWDGFLNGPLFMTDVKLQFEIVHWQSDFSVRVLFCWIVLFRIQINRQYFNFAGWLFVIWVRMQTYFQSVFRAKDLVDGHTRKTGSNLSCSKVQSSRQSIDFLNAHFNILSVTFILGMLNVFRYSRNFKFQVF